MANNSSRTTLRDLERATSYTPIPDQPPTFIQAGNRISKKLFASILCSSVFFVSLILLSINQRPEDQTNVNGSNQEKSTFTPISPAARPTPPSRGVAQGVSEKTFRRIGVDENVSYPWTNAMLSWQRTAYHFEPEQNWMNDPNDEVNVALDYVVQCWRPVGHRVFLWQNWESNEEALKLVYSTRTLDSSGVKGLLSL